MNRTRFRRWLVGLCSIAFGVSAAGCTPPPPPAHYSLVALGDSWAAGSKCGGCTTFVDRYAQLLNARHPGLVQVTDLARDGENSFTVRDELAGDQRIRAAVAGADIVVIEVGFEDVADTGALAEVAGRRCGGTDGFRCLRGMRPGWDERFDAIADAVDQLRGGRPTALRMVARSNAFLANPSMVVEHHLPGDFATTGGRIVVEHLTRSICHTAAQHHGACVDAGLLLNGPDGDRARDENDRQSVDDVAVALLDAGLTELG